MKIYIKFFILIGGVSIVLLGLLPLVTMSYGTRGSAKHNEEVGWHERPESVFDMFLRKPANIIPFLLIEGIGFGLISYSIVGLIPPKNDEKTT